MSKNYKLKVLPVFVEDLNNITAYISKTLKNPEAANKLVDDVEKAINDRLPVCESFDVYPSLNERKYPYYRINVRNFSVFYVVIGDIMEVRRILYSRRNLGNIIK